MSSATPRQYNTLIHPILIAGCVIIMLSFAIRASFGLFQIPIATEFNWLRSEFSLAIALQNLFWGIGQPIFGAFAEKYGDRKAIIIGIGCYALGLCLSAFAITPGQHQILESAGMIEVYAMQDGERLTMLPEKPIDIECRLF